MPLIRDTLLVFGRKARLSLRDPAWVIVGLIQPLLYLAFLGPLLNRIMVPGQHPGGMWRLFVPGLLIQLGLFGAGFAGLSIIADVRSGVFERMRVTPVSRLARCSDGCCATCCYCWSRRWCCCSRAWRSGCG